MGKDIKNADGYAVEYDIMMKSGQAHTFNCNGRIYDKLASAKTVLSQMRGRRKNFIEGRIIPLYMKRENTFVYLDGPSKPKPYDYLGDDDE